MSDDNEIEKPLGSDDDGHDEDEADVSKEMFFTVTDKEPKDSSLETALKFFVLAYMALLLTALTALTFRIFERRKS